MKLIVGKHSGGATVSSILGIRSSERFSNPLALLYAVSPSQYFVFASIWQIGRYCCFSAPLSLVGNHFINFFRSSVCP